MRLEKDAIIRHLTKDKEDGRNIYENKINDLEVLAKKSDSAIAELRSNVLELRSILTQKSDIEDQLEKER